MTTGRTLGTVTRWRALLSISCAALVAGCPLFAPPTPPGDDGDRPAPASPEDPGADSGGDDTGADPGSSVDPASSFDDMISFVQFADGGAVDLDLLSVGDSVVFTIPTAANTPPDDEPCDCAWVVSPSSAGLFESPDACTTGYVVAAPGPAMIRVFRSCGDAEEVLSQEIAAAMAEPSPTLAADAGADREVLEQSVVRLDAGASAGGSSLEFRWSQVTGPPVVLNDTGKPVASFTAPPVPCPQSSVVTLAFLVTVSDGDQDSAAEVTVTVRNADPCDAPPIIPPSSPPPPAGPGPGPACTVPTQSGDCNDQDPCTDDVCNAGVCQNPNNTAPCDDKNQCTTGDLCTAGACIGEPVDCSPMDNDCHTGECDGKTGLCVRETSNEGEPCDDGLTCTYDSVCSKGVCVGTPIDCSHLDDQCHAGVCNPTTELCESHAAHEGDGCTPDDRCTAGAACANGACVGEPLDCSALNSDCAVGMCDPANGLCVVVPIRSGEPCNDANACTIGESCGVSGQCTGGVSLIPQLHCDDANPCTQESCNPAVGCVNTPVVGRPCQDGNFCTSGDSCNAGGQCVPGAPLDPNVACNDSNACTRDECQSHIGCVNVYDVVGACDDQNPCTIEECSAQSGCTHTDITTISCGGIADCPVDATGCSNSRCRCDVKPDLCLVPRQTAAPVGDQGCLNGTQPVLLDVVMSYSTDPICTAQFFLTYDPQTLSFVQIVPGGDVFALEVFEGVNQAFGTIDYAVGASPTRICHGTRGPAVIATIMFEPVDPCGTGNGVCFRPHNPPTRMGSAGGQAVCPNGHADPTSGTCGTLVEPCCTGPLTFDGGAPVITCPLGDSGHSDCGLDTRRLTFAPVTAFDDCGGERAADCTISNSRATPVGGLLAGGGNFPPGTTTITCEASNACGQTASCAFEVGNTGLNGVRVDVELSPAVSANPFQRGVDFLLSECGGPNGDGSAAGCDEVVFSSTPALRGRGHAEFAVPPGHYDCIEAGDRLHTLRSSCDLVCRSVPGEGQFWMGVVDGAEGLDPQCHRLINGNLNSDNVIDIMDYVEYMNQVMVNPIPGPNTDCDDTALHGDVNGDGLVTLLDFSFVFLNFFQSDAAGCDVACTAAVAAGRAPRRSVTVAELQQLGLGAAGAAADRNHDGVVEYPTDMSLYLDNR
ncbi:MAG: hypothetical protein HOP29_01310 [Phycisphaerales bacterium]|nr:hypothetical protein [Phycisphaerales bacterium]